MKKSISLISMLVITGTAEVVIPNVSAYFDRTINYPAISAVNENSESKSYYRFIYNSYNMIDTVYNKFVKLNEDDLEYYSVYAYDLPNLKYSETIYYPSWQGDGTMEENFTIHKYYNELGMPLADTIITPYDQKPWVAFKYEYDSEGRVEKRVSTLTASNYHDADSTVWFYREGFQLDSIIRYFDDANSSKGLSIAVPFYSQGKMDSVQYFSAVDKQAESIYTGSLVYQFDDTSIKKTVNSSKSLLVTINSGVVNNIPQNDIVIAEIYHANGRRIQSLPLTSNNRIANWDQLSSGYYLIKLSGAGWSKSIPVLK